VNDGRLRYKNLQDLQKIHCACGGYAFFNVQKWGIRCFAIHQFAICQFAIVSLPYAVRHMIQFAIRGWGRPAPTIEPYWL